MKQIIASLLVFLILLCPITALAHSGRTDSNGGHYDRSDGSYHYHHGYPAHDHPNGVCPYEYSDDSEYASPSETFDARENYDINKAIENSKGSSELEWKQSGVTPENADLYADDINAVWEKYYADEAASSPSPDPTPVAEPSPSTISSPKVVASRYTVSDFISDYWFAGAIAFLIIYAIVRACKAYKEK